MGQRRDSHANGLAQQPRGFTLIELMLVLAIVGILAGIAISMSGNFVREQHLRGLVRGLFNAMSKARAEAVRRGVTTVVRLEGVDGSAEKTVLAARVVAFVDRAGGTAKLYDESIDTELFVYPQGSDEDERVPQGVIGKSMRPEHDGDPVVMFDSRGYCVDGAGSFASVLICLQDPTLAQTLAVEATVAGATRVVGMDDAGVTSTCSF